MILVVRVKLSLAEAPETALPGLKVALYDRDEANMDDFLASAVTAPDGEARIVFDSDSYTDEEDSPLWRIESLPDLYVMVYNKQGEVILTTREQFIPDHLPKVIAVKVPQKLL